MTESFADENHKGRRRWWRYIGPALITACVVFGPGSLLVSANIGVTHRYELLWLLIVTGILMGGYMSMAARIGVVGGASPCTLIARHLNRAAAVIIGFNLFLICATFQFGNNLAMGAAAGALFGGIKPEWIIIGLNVVIIVFLFTAKRIYHFLERAMKVMVAVILICFAANLVKAGPGIGDIARGLVPSLPGEVSFAMPKEVDGAIEDPMLLIVSLIGTTFSVVAAFYQGNLVREKGWGVKEYRQGIGDSIAGVAVLTCVSGIIMITTATVIEPGKTAGDIGMLAESLRPLLGSMSYVMFCVGLAAVSMNPFLINAMIGGSILADGMGLPAGLSDKWPRRLAVVVLLVGMTVAILALRTEYKPVKLVIMGQALTVLGNPLMAAAILWLANQKAVMGSYRNRIAMNILGGAGFLIVLYMAVRVLFLVVIKVT